MRALSSPRGARLVILTVSLTGCIGAGLTPIDDGTRPDASDAVSDVMIDASADVVTDAPVDASNDVTLPPTPLLVQSARWNASGMNLGAIAAVAEPESLLCLFGARGLQVLVGGTVSATDATETMWRAAAVVPASDGTTTPWAIGVASDGRIWRVRDRIRLEEVTSRYGLTTHRVRSVAALSGNRVAFGFVGGFAVADGTHVTLWSDPAFENLVGAAGRVASITVTGVRVFDVAREQIATFALAGVTSVAFGADDRLVVTTDNDLYVEGSSGALEPRIVDGAPMRSLARSASRVWLSAGDHLALWDGRELHTAADITIASGASLLASPSGDVWVLSSGALTRYGFVDSPELRQWEDTVRPVFARRCVPCHLPGGTGNLDLSGYSAWLMQRSAIRTQVVTRRLMPPPPASLTSQELTTISQWLDGDGGVRDASVDAPRTDAAVDVRDASVDTRG